MLTLYKNIKQKRLELKMSQDTLAELTGYKDRSSIAKIEKGEVDLAESKIREFAKALKTSPQDLMGWDNDESQAIDETAILAKKISQNKALLAIFESIKDSPPENLKAMQVMADALERKSYKDN